MDSRKRFYKGISFGIEYTYLYQNSHGVGSNAAYHLASLVALDFKEAKLDKDAVKNDSGVLEINSPAFKNFHQAQAFFDKMENIVRGYPVTTTPTQNVTGGGGHVHMSVPYRHDHQRLDLYGKLCRFLSTHPYIAWIFNEWGDNITAKNFNHIFWEPIASYICPYSLTRQYMDFLTTENRRGKLRHQFYGKGYVMRPDWREGSRKPLTFEFRAFDAKHSFRDVVDHVTFLNRMVAHVDTRKVPVSPYNTKKEFFSLGKGSRGIDEFRKLLNTLDLEEKNYERFYRNYELRSKKGFLA